MDKKEKQNKPPKPWVTPKDKLKKYPPALTDRQRAEGRSSKNPNLKILTGCWGSEGRIPGLLPTVLRAYKRSWSKQR